jgi:hypothetical protein
VPPLSELDAPGRGSDPTRPVPDRRPDAAEPAPADAVDGPAAGAVRASGGRRGPQPNTLWNLPPEQEENVLAAQRLVAEERAAVARAVLAERAAKMATARKPKLPRVIASYVLLGGAALVLAARLWLVGEGALFGRGVVHRLDAAVAIAIALGLALGARPRQGYVRLAVTLGLPALVLVGATLVQPAIPTSAPAAACPAAPVRGSGTTAVITAGSTARTGPGREYETSGRFPAGCAVAVTGYCLGDAMPSGGGWVDGRWLLVQRRAGGPTALVSRHLSGEPDRPRFLSAAATALTGPDLRALPAADCGDAPTPGPASLEDVAPPGRPPLDPNLAATVGGAANVGFAVWVAPDPATGRSPLLRGEPYRQVPAGAAGLGGRREVRWDYPTLVRDLDPARATWAVTVAVLAIGCEAPAAPADAGTAGVTMYRIEGRRLSPAQQRLRGTDVGSTRDPALRGLDLDRLAAAACAPPA